MLVLQCADRERLNPIDPQNPETGGKPVGLKIYSEFDVITLSWDPIQVQELMGYHVYRKITGESAFQIVRLVAADSNQFTDINVNYTRRYSYRIAAVTAEYESPLSDSISIIPGATVIWATDVDNRRIIKISHDGLHEIRRYAVDGYPWDIVIHPADRSIWYADIFLGFIYQIKDDSYRKYVSNNWAEPVDLALDIERGIVWGADIRGMIFKITPLSSDSLQEITSVEFQSPYAVAVNQWRGDCWVADPSARKVFIISELTATIRSCPIDFYFPIALAIDNSDGSCWVADSSRILKINATGTTIIASNEDFHYANTLDLNQATDELWVIDAGSNESNPRIVKLDGAGNFLLEVTELAYPKNIVVNPENNGCVVADVSTGKIYRLSATGEVLSEIGNYYFPRGLAIEYKNR